MTHPVITQLLQRRSVRQFSGAAVAEADLQLILQAAQQAPTSINGQQVSLIVTRDKARIARIAELAGGQPQVAGADVFITLVMDFNRTAIATELAGATQVIEQSAEGLMAGAVDVGIMLNAIQTAANALGYGSTAIGGIRANPAAMIDLLQLPSKTFPLAGLTLGVPDPSQPGVVKPRVPLASFAMNEHYNQQAVRQGVEQYDQQLRQFWDSIGLREMPSYAQSTASYYQRIYFPTVAENLQQQGFAFKDQ
ncbi:nitroreductase family protein [Balneatrix alpica]|uniref:nitroreductase family protein n=1 Tax=Balneatrix alpica TaxID=75684 RepID=UPI0027387F6E|nr:nitroreductase family protein [Balneatrix alpica]